MTQSTKIKLTVIIGCIVSFGVVPTAAVLYFSHSRPTNTTPPISLTKRSNEELLAAVVASEPDLRETNGKPLIAPISTKQPLEGWYILTIRRTDDPDGTNPAKVVLQDTPEHGLKLLLGPGTYFPNEDVSSLGIPLSVIRELNS